MVRQKKPSRYQAEQVYSGKGKSLTLGNYLILDKLGQGGMGMVLKARHRRMDRLVALKVMSPAALKSPDAVKRFHREVQAVAKLTHPNIVIAHDADEANGTHFLVMEFVDGMDLSVLVQKHGPLPVDQAVRCIVQAARGLEFTHAQGVIHRDIKPANLLIDQKGTVKILDLGLARIDGAVGDSSKGAGLTPSGSKGTAVVPSSRDDETTNSSAGEAGTDPRNEQTLTVEQSQRLQSAKAATGRRQKSRTTILVSVVAAVIVLLAILIAVRGKSGTLHLEITDELTEVTIGDTERTLPDKADDVTPLRALTGLKKLTIVGGPHWLDLSPLNSTPLESLTCRELIARRNAHVLKSMPKLTKIDSTTGTNNRCDGCRSQVRRNHRDNKLANLLLDNSGMVKILDMLHLPTAA